MSTKCKECGKAIEWIEYGGKRIPLDVRAETYQFDGQIWLKSSASVNHFSVCKPDPSAVKVEGEIELNPAYLPPEDKRYWEK